MTKLKTIVFATGNKGKLKEAKEIFSSYTVKSIFEYTDIFDPLESGDTFFQNALIKAETAKKIAPDAFILSDDSGLVIDSLDGNPGIFSARYAGENATDESNRQKALKEMNSIVDRSAHFLCAAVLLFPDYTSLSTVGKCLGTITEDQAGSNGFGYDPIFMPKNYDKTMAELTQQQKHSISHRGIAFRKLEKLSKCILD